MARGRGNRGKSLEMDIETANMFYKMRKIARIDKAATPIKNLGPLHGRFNEFRACYDKASTVDFYGSVKGGKAVYFDAKATEIETRYPIADKALFKPHQIEFLNEQHSLGALCFLVIDFTKLREAYFVPWPVVMEYLEAAAAGGKKSIPYSDFVERSDLYKISTAQGFLDYLEPIIIGSYENGDF